MKWDRGKMLIFGLAGAALAFAGSMISHLFAPLAKPGMDPDLIKMVSDMNRVLPIMVDKETRLDNAAVDSNETLIYRFTLVNFNASDFPKNLIEEQLRPRFVEAYKTDPHDKVFRDKGVTLHAVFSDKNGAYITEMIVIPHDLR